MAGPTRAAGHPSYAHDSSSSFIPALWSGRLVAKFYAATVFGAIANTDYEGEIKQKGDSVTIRTVPSMVIRDYEIGGGLKYDKPSSPSVELKIDKAKYFAFEVNDIDAHQSDLNLMDKWSEDGSEQMKIAIDTDILANIYSQAGTDNAGTTAGKLSGDVNLGATGSPVALTSSNILEVILRVGQVLDEQNLPETGRWLILPAWACNLIKTSDLKDASLSGDGVSPLRNGRIGRVDNFEIFKSNNLSMVTDGANKCTNIVAGHKSGLTFASQMTQMETLPNPNDFGKLVRGLNVYGYKVVEGDYLAHLYAYKG